MVRNNQISGLEAKKFDPRMAACNFDPKRLYRFIGRALGGAGSVIGYYMPLP